jgi:hypothetical protein
MSTDSGPGGGFRDADTKAWKRVEPWMTTFVNLQTGHAIGNVDGRHSATVTTWPAARSDQSASITGTWSG